MSTLQLLVIAGLVVLPTIFLTGMIRDTVSRLSTLKFRTEEEFEAIGYRLDHLEDLERRVRVLEGPRVKIDPPNEYMGPRRAL